MTPEQYFKAKTREQLSEMAKRAGTTYRNFRMIAVYGGSCSAALARSLELASNFDMTLREILFPDEYEYLSEDDKVLERQQALDRERKISVNKCNKCEI